MLNLFSPKGYELFIFASIALSLSLVPIALTKSVAPNVPPSARVHLRGLLAISPLGVVGCFAVGLANGAFWGMAPVFGREIGLSVSHISFFMSAVILGGLVMQVPIGRLSDRFDRRKILVISCCLNALSAVAIFFFCRGTEGVLLLLGFIFGGFALTLYSLCVAHTDDFLEKDDLVEASSILLFAFGMGALFGPTFASFSMAALGPEGLFLHIAAVSVGLAIYAIVHVFMIPPTQRQEKFVMVPETTPGVHQLDPRTHLETQPSNSAGNQPSGSPDKIS
jgi:MFS family permease